MKKDTPIHCKECDAFGSSVFNTCTDEELSAINKSKIVLQYKKGTTLFNKGEIPYQLYCLNKGSVKLSRLNAHGKEQIIHLAKAGDVLGFRAILSEDNYSCSAITMEDCVICAIPKNKFVALVKTNPKLSFKVIELFAKKLKETEQSTSLMATHSVKERVCKALLILKDNYGFLPDGKTIDIQLSRENFAHLAGTTRETATRTLFNLQKDNIILLNQKKIILLNVKELIKLSDNNL